MNNQQKCMLRGRKFSLLQTCEHFMNTSSCSDIICWNETDPDLLRATSFQAKPSLGQIVCNLTGA